MAQPPRKTPPHDYEDPPDHEEPKPSKEQPPPEAQRVIPVGEEQLKRSQEMEAMGIEKWKLEHDERKPGEQAKAVPGASLKEH